MIVKGKLIKCKRESGEIITKRGRKVEKKERLYLSLAEVELSDNKRQELLAVYAESGDQYTPTWLKKFEGYVNLNTNFDLPCKDIDGNEFGSIEDMLADNRKYPWMNADVKVSINLKDGAIYPAAIVFVSEGKSFDPFEEFDNDEED